MAGPLLALVSWFATVFSAASTACAESGTNYADGAIVLHVVERRRTVSGWARYKGTTRLSALFVPRQHANRCRIGIRRGHVELGVRYAAGMLEVPAWARTALFYCGKYDRPGQCESYSTRKTSTVLLGQVEHSFWGVQKR